MPISFSKNGLKYWNKIKINNQKEELSYSLMKINNPIYIARNHKVEESLNDIINNDDYKKFYSLLKVLKTPYLYKKKYNDYLIPGDLDFQKNFKTFCGT